MASHHPSESGDGRARRARLAELLAARAASLVGPLSAGQRALWFLHRAASESAAYHVPSVLRIRSPVAVPDLERLMTALLERHATLRTTYELVDGGLVQRVQRAAPVRVDVTDATGLDAAALGRAFREEIARPFDLAAGPVVRTRLFRRGPSDHYFVQTYHHIAVDAHSQRVLIEDLRHLVEPGSARPPAGAPYLEFVSWQERLLAGADGEALRTYWRDALAGAPTVLDLPTDHPRPAERADWGANHPFEVPEEIAERLRALARSCDVTLYVVLLAAFEVLLARRTGCDDLLVGTYVSGRSTPQFARTVGDFVNTVPIRADLSGNPEFRELVRRTDERVVGALAHQDYPFSLLVADTLKSRESSRPPLVQVTFVLQSLEEGWESTVLGTGGRALAVGPWALESYGLAERPTESELKLELAATRDGLIGALVYDATLFEPATAAEMVAQYRAVLRAIVDDPSRRIGALPLADAASGRARAEAWRPRTDATDAATSACVHTAFEAHVDRSPDRLAVAWRGERWTYARLEEAANRLAHRLRALGAAPETIVGVCLERSPTLLAALLGVLKAGAAYLPLDPAYPERRLAEMTAGAAAPLVVTRAALASRLAPGPRHVLVDDPAVAAAPATRPIGTARPEHLAYVMFTSASTGPPKGVAVEHRHVVSFLDAARAVHTEAELAGVLASTSISFDISVSEIFLALTSGGTLILVDSLLALDDLPSEPPVRKVTGTPSVLSELARRGRLPASAVTYSLVGEAATAGLVRALHREPRVTRVMNNYGPTETTVYNTAAELPADLAVTPPLGPPLGSSSLYLLDETLRPVPPGVVGEICIGGGSVARGYLGAPNLTAERFVADVVADRRGARMYRTGDLGRERADGSLEFLGRADRQVKLHGCRIELGEVESALTEQPGVSESVVTVDGTGAERTLVAYVVSERAGIAVHELRGQLLERLPRHAVPSTIVALERLPRLPNGKIDRRALPAVRGAAIPAAESANHPAATMERAIAEAFAAVLRVPAVGADDDFFALGGHSLQALEVAARLTTALACPVSVKLLLQHPVVADLASALRSDGSGDDRNPSPSAGRGLTVVREPLDRLIARGELPAFDVAAIGYFADDEAATAAELRARLGSDPIACGCIVTHLGRIGLILLPATASELVADPRRAARIAAGTALGRRLGATVTALTGILPSITDHGRDVAASGDAGTLTTGHAATTAAIILNTLALCRLAGTAVTNRSLAFLGLGAIGRATLLLALRTLPEPARLALCDVYANRDALDALARDVRAAGWSCPLDVAVSPHPGTVPDGLYDADLILGATNAGPVLDVERLRPGTLVVDDASPHCFDVNRALARIERDADVLVTEGGALRLDVDPDVLLSLPPGFDELGAAFAARHAGLVMACTLSALFAAQDPDLAPIVGPVATEAGVRHFRHFAVAGMTAPPPQCDGVRLAADHVARYRARFGRPGGPTTT